jgi:hypothetical protein
MNKRFSVTVSRSCYQYKDFTVYADNADLALAVAQEDAAEYDWSNIPTDETVIKGLLVEEVKPERQVTIIFGEMIFEEEDDHLFCTIETEQMRVQAPISKAEEFAENIISEGLYVSYVIPELYEGRII